MKRKKVSGQHATPRATTQLPADWLAVARELAADKKMPAMWFLVELIEQAATAAGRKDLPAPPWKPQPPA